MLKIKQLKNLLTILLFTSISFASQANDIDSFVNYFKDAVKENDIPRIIEMNHWAGVPEQQRKSLEASFSDLADKGIINLRIEKIENGESIIFKNKFAPNLAPVAKIFIEVNTNKDFRGGYSYYIGKNNNELKFSHIVLKNS